MSVPRPLERNGAFDCALATARSAATSGRASTVADSRRMKQVCLPEPRRSFRDGEDVRRG